MKKIYSFLLLAFFGANVSAQNSMLLTDFTNGQAVINNNDYVYRSADINELVSVKINVKNISNATKTYKVERYDDMLSSGASAYMCVGAANCYPPTVTVTPVGGYVTLAAGEEMQSQNTLYWFDLEEDATPGTSEIRYRIININDASDMTVITLRYNSPLSVKNISSVSNISDVYPNPASNRASVSVNTTKEVQGTAVLLNSLGAVVQTKQLNFGSGKNVISFDTEALTSGIYFVNLNIGDTKQIKKLIINK